MRWLRVSYLLWAALALASLPIFYDLDGLALRRWDESRNLLNSFEMYQSGELMIKKYQGQPDLWETKPNLLNWVQVGFFKVFGPGVWAGRLPSAVAAFLTCLTLLWLFGSKLKAPVTGAMAIIILISNEGYVRHHGIRTAESDSLLTLFLLLQAIFIFLYFEDSRRKWLFLFFGALSGAVLTKGISGMLFCPPLFFYAIGHWGKFKTTLSAPALYLSLGVFLVLVIGFYGWREHLLPGYLEAVWNNELGGRYFGALEGNGHPFSFYFGQIYQTMFSYWLLFLAAGLYFSFRLQAGPIRRFPLLVISTAILFLLIISFGQTKLPWYDVPVYPLFACISALGLYQLLMYLQSRLKIHFGKAPVRLIIAIIASVILVIPYLNTLSKWRKLIMEQGHEEYHLCGYYLHKAILEKRNIDGYFIEADGYYKYEPNLEYYLLHLNEVLDQEVKSFVATVDTAVFSPGNIIATPYPYAKERIAEGFEFEILEDFYQLQVFKLGERKSPSH
jgi:4-amino-4-deoxy-L-arabinose transferase-like glycosyltransferase